MSEVYNQVKGHFLNDDQVIVNIGKGAQGIKLGKKFILSDVIMVCTTE